MSRTSRLSYSTVTFRAYNWGSSEIHQFVLLSLSIFFLFSYDFFFFYIILSLRGTKKARLTEPTLWRLIVLLFCIREQELGEGPSAGLQALIGADLRDQPVHQHHNLINVRQKADAVSHQDPGLQKHKQIHRFFFFTFSDTTAFREHSLSEEI